MDISDYLTRRTCSHVQEQIKGSSFRDSMFSIDSEGQIPIWNGYTISFVDEGSVVKLIVCRRSGGIDELAEKIGELKVEGKYEEVISSTYVENSGDKFIIGARMKKREGTSDRTRNKDKLFYAIYNTAVKPVFKAVFS